MTLILAVGLVWLVAATAVGIVIGRAIRLADERQIARNGVDAFLAECLATGSATSPGHARTA